MNSGISSFKCTVQRLIVLGDVLKKQMSVSPKIVLIVVRSKLMYFKQMWCYYSLQTVNIVWWLFWFSLLKCGQPAIAAFFAANELVSEGLHCLIVTSWREEKGVGNERILHEG